MHSSIPMRRSHSRRKRIHSVYTHASPLPSWEPVLSHPSSTIPAWAESPPTHSHALFQTSKKKGTTNMPRSNLRLTRTEPGFTSSWRRIFQKHCRIWRLWVSDRYFSKRASWIPVCLACAQSSCYRIPSAHKLDVKTKRHHDGGFSLWEINRYLVVSNQP